jgi:hypothetical protein
MQEIIVYRNPAEAAFWHAFSGPFAFPIICGIIAFFATLFTLNYFLERRIQWSPRGSFWRKYGTGLMLTASAFVGIVITRYMII